MTGNNLHIVTPQQTMSARDMMEYWSQKHMAVGRGNAVVNTSDGRRLSADVLVGYTADPNAPSPGHAQVQKAAATEKRRAGPRGPLAGKEPPVGAWGPGEGGPDPPGAQAGKLQRGDAFGHVEVRTATEIIHADKGVYVPDTQIARLAGNVHITRGENQLNGDEALINLRTGVSTMVRRPGGRVEGLVVPNDASSGGAAKSSAVGPVKPKESAK